MENPNITIEEYIRLEEEKARRHGKVYNWETATYENDNDKVNMPSLLSLEPEASYSNDLDFFKDFENEFPAIVYNDALTSKSDFLTEHIVSPQHIDEFNNKTSLTECDKKEQNVLYFNDLFPFNVIYPDDLKSDTDNDNDKIDIEQPSGDINYGVTCEDKAKRCNSKAKTKTFEEYCYLLPYTVSSNKDTAYQRQLITRIRVMINSRFGVSTLHPYAVCPAGHHSKI
ncbi:hypothetical protein Tco_1501613 [Tanacetum coccineum]